MADKTRRYSLRGVTAYVDKRGIVRLNTLNEDLDEAGLEAILKDPLSTKDYPMLKYSPPLSDDEKPARHAYVQLNFRLAKSDEEQRNGSTIRDHGLNRLNCAFGYIETSETQMDSKKKHTIDRALKAYEASIN